MDDRNGTMYPSREAAQEAGVPDEHIKEIRIIRSGPFRGRRYEVKSGKRVKPDATKEEMSNE